MADPNTDWPTLLREFRASNGLKQAAAADHLGVSQATISRWERGEIEPTTAIRNRIFKALRRARAPLSTQNWVRTFRRLPCPGTVTSRDNRLLASTGVVGAMVGVAREAIEGLQTDEVFRGDIVENRARVREAGMFAGEVASMEACLALEFNPEVRRNVRLNLHVIGWPHFSDDGQILLVCQGAVVTDERAREVRERLGGLSRFDLAA
ncbi:MAG: helix-turn-helix transcriptional regulator [Maricaulaceae bacterium]|jgi:transcriptional regulator with XRE-family HTH domain